MGISFSSAQAGTLAQFRTRLGDLEVELFDQDKPVTVENFLRHVRSGAYTNVIIHRWVPGFVIQGGGYYVTTRSNTTIIDAIARQPAITNEYAVGRKFSNTYGTLAMARVGGMTNSATSEWFINLGNNAGLDAVDGGFTVFGRVLSGTNLLNRFNNTATSNGVFLARLGSPLNELPVLSPTPGYQDLIYVDISLLRVQVLSRSNGGKEIRWTSVSNRLNHLETSDTLPPRWQNLATTNGTGGSVTFTDTDTRSSTRFYRVRVDY